MTGALFYDSADIREFVSQRGESESRFWSRRPFPLHSEEWRSAIPNLVEWQIALPDRETVAEPGAPLRVNTSQIPPQSRMPGVNYLLSDKKRADDLVLQIYHNVNVAFTTFGFAVWRGDCLYSCSSAVPAFVPGAAPDGPSDCRLNCGLYVADFFRTNNIAHYTFDYIGRAVLGSELIGLKQQDLLFPPAALDYQRFIKAATFPGSQEVATGVVYYFDKFYLFHDSSSRLNHPARHCDDRVMSYLRDNVFRALKGAMRPRGRYYFSRRDAQNVRPVEDEAGIEIALAESGYIPLQMSRLAPEDQILIAAGASEIVAPHGAALTNIAFSEPGTRITEIMSPNIGTLTYFKVANWARLDYRLLPAEVDPGTSKMRVNLEAVIPVSSQLYIGK